MPPSITAGGNETLNVIGDLERAFAAAIYLNVARSPWSP
jgi:hypothetical protein